MDIVKEVKFGKRKDHLKVIRMTLSTPQQIELNADIELNVDYEGWCSTITWESDAERYSKELCANGQFDAYLIAFKALRQLLRRHSNHNPGIKYFECVYGVDKTEYLQVSIEDLFETHDCITFEMEDMIQFAKEHGYTANGDEIFYP